MTPGRDNGIVRILDENGMHCGMGILVRPSMVVTCAHVVNLALGKAMLSRERPVDSSRIRVAFPIVRNQPERQASIVGWSAPVGAPINDLCLLQLHGSAPPEAGTAIIADLRETVLDQDQLSVFGFAPNNDVGRHVEAHFVGRANAAWVQIDSASEAGAFIEPGFSGAAVWDHEHQCAIGIVVARQDDPGIRTAYMLSASHVLDFAEEIPCERRSLPDRFSAWWTIYAITLFFVLLFHFLAERSAEFPAFLSLGGGNKIMAGYYGLNLGAVFIPPFIWMTIAFARSRREHPWWMRIPELGRFGVPARPSRRRLTTILSLLFLVLWPLWEQGHFLLRLHKQGEVYIYRSALNDEYKDIEKKFPGTRCFMPSVHYCTHPEAELYGTAKTGIKNDQYYLENMYHYGDRSYKIPASATFFPIWQPVLLIGLTILCGVRAAVLGRTIFRPAERSRDRSLT